MGFLVEFDVNVPDGAARSEVEERQSSEAAGAAKLVDEGHLIRIWKPPVAPGEATARLARGEDVDASEYTFRASTQIETAAAELDWLNKGVFIAVGGRRPGGVIYETHLVG